MPRARAINVGEVRRMSDREIVNRLLTDTTSMAVYRRVLDERLRRDKSSEFYFWVMDGNDPRPRKASSKKLEPLRDFVKTPTGGYLDAELSDYLDRYPFFDDEYNPLDKPSFCREFCEDKGRRSGDNIYGKTIEDLSDNQYKMVLAIRAHAGNWLTRERIRVRREKNRNA